MSSTSITPAIETASIHAESAEISTTDTTLTAEATRLAATLRALLAVCAATIARKAHTPVLESTAEGDETRATWAGIRFAGGRKQRHTGQGHTTYCWSISGQSSYITAAGAVYLIDWDGKASDFGGCEGYMDVVTSEVTGQSLEDHLELNPESAPEIVEALRKAVSEDLRQRKSLVDEIAAVIARLH